MSFSVKDAFTMDPVYDVGTYEAPSWTVDDNFFKYDPETTGGIDWSDIYANKDVLSGSGGDFGSDLLKNSLKFVGDYYNSKGSGTDEQSQYLDAQKAAAGLPTDKSRDPWYKQISDRVGIYGGGGFYGGGGPGSMVLPAVQGAQSLANIASMNPGMQNLGFNDYAKMAAQGLGKQLMNKALYGINPVLGAVNQFYPGGATEAFKDVGRFAGGVMKKGSDIIGSVVNPVKDFLDNIFCDERLKVDIAPLESTEINDELAQMAFFVKGIRECS
jgi:hypothetical protein